MKLYLLRHGEADWPDWDRSDEERPLTKKGRKEMRRMAKFLCDLKVCPATILSSPLRRARQTAKIVADCLNLQVQEELELAPGFNATRLRRLIDQHAGDDLMMVGHEPDFSAVIRSLTGGRVRLAKGGIARVDLSDEGTDGQLTWLFPPKAAR
jgi:phosphohistidine phosphatase